MADIGELEATLHRSIPLTAAMQIRVRQADAGSVILAAPLIPNQNDKQTAFAGSIATLATVTGWCMASELLPAAGQIVAQDTTIRYLQPITGEFDAHCQAPNAAVIERYQQHYQRRGLARIELTVSVKQGDVVCAELTGRYVASAG